MIRLFLWPDCCSLLFALSGPDKGNPSHTRLAYVRLGRGKSHLPKGGVKAFSLGRNDLIDFFGSLHSLKILHYLVCGLISLLSV